MKNLYMILCCMPLFLYGQAGTLAGAGTGTERKNIRELPMTDTVIASIGDEANLGVPTNIMQLTVWPAATVVEIQTARTDRSHTILPVYPTKKLNDPKPVILGALSPSAACKEAAWWIREVLKPAYIPGDLESRLVLIQCDPASQSAVFCRYEIDGHAIQISQMRSVMWVVIKPSLGSGVRATNPEAVAVMLKDYFTKGAEMALVKGLQKQKTRALEIYVPDPFTPQSKSANENWWGWRLWYSDGHAIAVLLTKCTQDSAHTVTTNDPWF